MLARFKSLEWQFGLAALVGFLFLLVVPGLLLSSSVCQPRPYQLPTERAAQTAGEQQRANDEPPILWLCKPSPTDLALVFFTYCLVIVGWAAIRSSEQSAWAIERPRVRLHKLKFSRMCGTVRDKNKVPIITVSFKNYGRTVAVITRIRLVIKVVGTLPDKPDYEDSLAYVYVPAGQTIAPEGEFEPQPKWFFDFDKFLPEPNTPVAEAGLPFRARFWVYGYVAYLDHLDRERTMDSLDRGCHLTPEIPLAIPAAKASFGAAVRTTLMTSRAMGRALRRE